jgi:hypothetical protein
MPADGYGASVVVGCDENLEELCAGVTVFTGQTAVHLEIPAQEYENADDLSPDAAEELAEHLVKAAAIARGNGAPLSLRDAVTAYLDADGSSGRYHSGELLAARDALFDLLDRPNPQREAYREALAADDRRASTPGRSGDRS